MILTEVTAGVSTRGTSGTLATLLSGILAGVDLPGQILIRHEGAGPYLADHLLVQMIRLARIKKVDISLVYAESTNVRDSRDDLMRQCPTRYLWMLDDDVWPETWCLAHLGEIAYDVPASENCVFIAGSKPDMANLRGQATFDMTEHPLTDLTANVDQNWIWEHDDRPMAAPTCFMDTGNCLFEAQIIADNAALRFRRYPDHFNCSGDDTVFALVLKQNGYCGQFVPTARAWHLDKASGGFNETQALGEALLRTCDVSGLDKTTLRQQWRRGSVWAKVGIDHRAS